MGQHRHRLHRGAKVELPSDEVLIRVHKVGLYSNDGVARLGIAEGVSLELSDEDGNILVGRRCRNEDQAFRIMEAVMVRVEELKGR